ncbi:MAG: glycerol-3-phosphate transporter ATP-binding protein [Microvirga sp.]|jgi:multiple sugar transport system ATP-binding protein|nr:glycerol-3-phosphate transporter ATP-binding protein [Microvirga sp.]
MAGIRIENVTKSYGPLSVLKDFSLEVADGEFVVFVGPSGCGKSTMLKILAGLEEASSGTIRIGGRDVTDLAPGDRDIAMVFQNYALYPHLTVRNNMGFGLKMRGMDAAQIEMRVMNAAKILGVDHLLDRRPKALSGGQRQRVALGRAIVREPQAFLMDEPLSNLDAKLRVHTRAEISALHKRLGVTTIYVTHDQIEAMTMADRIVIMKDGVIQQIANPDTMFRKPANLFVAGFIGSPGMNFLRSPVTTMGGAAAVRLFGHDVRLEAPASLAGREIVVGLRPEHIGAGSGPVTFEVTPRLVESLGSEKYIYVDVPEENRAQIDPADRQEEERRADTIIARLINPDERSAGKRITLSFDPAHLHLFDAKSELAIQ